MRILLAFLLMFLGACAPKVPILAKTRTVVSAQVITQASPSEPKAKPALKFYRSLVTSNAVILPIGPINKATFLMLAAVIEQAEKENRDILLVFSSPGGEVDLGFKMISMIENAGTKVTCLADPTVASMGSMVFLGCHERLATPRARFLFHGPKFSMQMDGTTIREMRENVEEAEAIQDTFCSHVAYATQWGKKDCMAAMANSRDVWMSAEEALRLGIVTKIVAPGQVASPVATKLPKT